MKVTFDLVPRRDRWGYELPPEIGIVTETELINGVPSIKRVKMSATGVIVVRPSKFRVL
jgi:hypothetical protein